MQRHHIDSLDIIPCFADPQRLVADGTYRLAESQTDWDRLDAMTEEEVERLAAEDMAELGIAPDWMEHATVVFPRAKERVTIRLDPDVLDWLKAQGRGYQTRINAILRAYYEAQKMQGDRQHRPL